MKFIGLCDQIYWSKSDKVKQGFLMNIGSTPFVSKNSLKSNHEVTNDKDIIYLELDLLCNSLSMWPRQREGQGLAIDFQMWNPEQNKQMTSLSYWFSQNLKVLSFKLSELSVG